MGWGNLSKFILYCLAFGVTCNAALPSGDRFGPTDFTEVKALYDSSLMMEASDLTSGTVWVGPCWQPTGLANPPLILSVFMESGPSLESGLYAVPELNLGDSASTLFWNSKRAAIEAAGAIHPLVESDAEKALIAVVDHYSILSDKLTVTASSEWIRKDANSQSGLALVVKYLCEETSCGSFAKGDVERLCYFDQMLTPPGPIRRNSSLLLSRISSSRRISRRAHFFLKRNTHSALRRGCSNLQ